MLQIIRKLFKTQTKKTYKYLFWGIILKEDWKSFQNLGFHLKKIGFKIKEND